MNGASSSVTPVETLVQRAIRRRFVGRLDAAPEPVARETHVPVRKLVDETLDRATGRLRVVAFEIQR